jgi:hypothetical protein
MFIERAIILAKEIHGLTDEEATATNEHVVSIVAALEAEAEEQKVIELSNAARAYLADTDWYVTRQAETGKAIPERVLAGRAKARASVV